MRLFDLSRLRKLAFLLFVIILITKYAALPIVRALRRSGSGIRYHSNNEKTLIFAEMCEALDGTVARNVVHQPNFLIPTWRRTLAQVVIKVKRACAPTLLYSNSVCIFYPVLLLIHDLELNPGPPSSLGKKPKSREVKVTIVHLNVRSMASSEKFCLVKQTIVHDNYDIFVVSESWLDPSTTNDDIQILGYAIFRQDRGPHKSGGGIVVYIRNSFKALIIDNLSTTTDANSQQLWLEVQCRKSKSFLLCAAYRPDSVSMTRFLDDFTASFIDSLILGMEVMVTGNTNSIWKVINHCLPNKGPPLTTVEDPLVQAKRLNGFYVSVGVDAAAKAKALCDHSGFSDESVEVVVPPAEDLHNAIKF